MPPKRQVTEAENKTPDSPKKRRRPGRPKKAPTDDGPQSPNTPESPITVAAPKMPKKAPVRVDEIPEEIRYPHLIKGEISQFLPQRVVQVLVQSKRRKEWLAKSRWLLAVLFYRVRWFEDDTILNILQAIRPPSSTVPDTTKEYPEFRRALAELQTAIVETHIAVACKYIFDTENGRQFMDSTKANRKCRIVLPSLNPIHIKHQLNLGFEDIKALWQPIQYAVSKAHWSPTGWGVPGNKAHFDALSITSYEIIASYGNIIARTGTRSISDHAKITTLKLTSVSSCIDSWPQIPEVLPKVQNMWEEWTEVSNATKTQAFRRLISRLGTDEDEVYENDQTRKRPGGLLEPGDDVTIHIADSGEFSETHGSGLGEASFRKIKETDEGERQDKSRLASIILTSDEDEEAYNNTFGSEDEQGVDRHLERLGQTDDLFQSCGDVDLCSEINSRDQGRTWPPKTPEVGIKDELYIPQIAFQIATLGPLALAEYVVGRLEVEGEKIERAICGYKSKQDRNLQAISIVEERVKTIKRDRVILANAREEYEKSTETLKERREQEQEETEGYSGNSKSFPSTYYQEPPSWLTPSGSWHSARSKISNYTETPPHRTLVTPRTHVNTASPSVPTSEQKSVDSSQGPESGSPLQNKTDYPGANQSNMSQYNLSEQSIVEVDENLSNPAAAAQVLREQQQNP